MTRLSFRSIRGRNEAFATRFSFPRPWRKRKRAARLDQGDRCIWAIYRESAITSRLIMKQESLAEDIWLVKTNLMKHRHRESDAKVSRRSRYSRTTTRRERNGRSDLEWKDRKLSLNGTRFGSLLLDDRAILAWFRALRWVTIIRDHRHVSEVIGDWLILGYLFSLLLEGGDSWDLLVKY